MSLTRKISGLAKLFGFDIGRFAGVWSGLVWYSSDWRKFKKSRGQSSDASFDVGKMLPCLSDRSAEGGTASGMYFHQDFIAAQLIYDAMPERHVDVGSRVDGFVAHVAVFCPVEVLDVRPITTSATNISFRQADLMEDIEDLVDYTPSLSCLNVLEHFGLGRYGDPIDYDGHKKGFANLVRMLAPGGKFYFSVPISNKQRIEFNAHRLFSIPYLLEMFNEHELEVESFHYIDDNGELQRSVDWLSKEAQNTFNQTFGCGVFSLLKKDNR